MAQNWVMMISELHRYQGVSYKSDIIVISGDTSNIMQSVVLLKPRIQLHVSTYLNMYNHNYKYIREGLSKKKCGHFHKGRVKPISHFFY